MTDTPSASDAYQQHGHQRCIHQALATARQLCREKGLRLTPLREQVFTFIWQSHKPLGAYSLLEMLAEAGKITGQGERREQKTQRRQPGPPTIYRALEFLQSHGLVHRIASLNAYIGCCHPTSHHHSHFLICRHCDTTMEIATGTISSAIHSAADAVGFLVESECVEVIGLCPNCLPGEQQAKTLEEGL